METPTACDRCAAVDCEARFHACLAADFSDPAYGVVHHLVVPTYGLQHGWYTEQAAPRLVEFVLDHLDREPTDHDRREIRRLTDGATRVRARGPGAAPVAWQHNVADVDVASAEAYVATVRAWAASVARTCDTTPGSAEHGR
ncbi:DUF5946 family protein [Nitriliruptor alkaliphilus]|uniref:DUF5946 family protein n=1 Tax=Nitriliruptor alkaliphilus TaxID=427918 RepID=UPI000697487A|nr:DUF5946 family protein [Nitriliruptor alkaliphilus]